MVRKVVEEMGGNGNYNMKMRGEKKRKRNRNWIQKIISTIWRHAHERWTQRGKLLGEKSTKGSDTV